MNSTTANVAKQSSDSLTDRLRAFMSAHHLSVEELAALLRTPPETLEYWFSEGVPPPACMLALMVLLETLPQARSRLGVTVGATSAGSPFRFGNGFRFSENKEEALKRVRAI